jgi:predicted PurR-regulated permease PerM
MTWELRSAVLIFFLSLGTSAALRPAIEQLHRWGLPKSLALAVTYLGCVVAFVALALALAFPLAANVQEFAGDFKSAYQDVAQTWPQGNAVQRALARSLPSWDDLQRVSLRAAETVPVEADAPREDDATEPAQPSSDAWWTPRAVHTVLGATWGFFGTILNVLIIVVLSLYWSIDRIHFERLWLSLLDVDRRQRARDTWRAVEQATGAYLQREVVQSLAAGIMLGIGFSVFRQPYPILSAAVGALAWLIPWIGAPLAMISVTAIWLPRFLLAGGQGTIVTLLAAALYTLLVLMLLEWLVEPRLFRRKRYNPILLVLVAVGMVDWLGFFGLLIAPPVAAAVQILGGQYLAQRAAAAAEVEISPRALAGRLATLRARMADTEGLREETKSVVERLGSLVDRARDELDLTATASSEST